MTMVETFQRYRDLIKALLPPLPKSIQSTADRAVYPALVVYHRLMTFQRQYETLPRAEFGKLDEALRAAADALEATIESATLNPVTAWSALALHVAGTIFIRDAWTDQASDVFGRLTRGQQADGRFFAASASTHPEITWYDELATLHAAASYAVQTEDRNVARAVARSAKFIQREIEPDHATREPWALFACVWNESTRPLADQILHGVQLRKNNLDGVSLILLHDALYCLELFLPVAK
jgi:hypothetical protein